MFKKLKTLSLAASVLVAGAAAGQAATFDFVDLIDNPSTGIGESSWSTSAVAGGWTVGGITVNASAQGGYNAYLDSNVAGLGVCKVTGTLNNVPGQCTPGKDDNVQTGETLVLSFSRLVKITSIILRDAAHNLFVLGDTMSFTGASGSGTYVTGTTGAALSNLFGQGTSWDFTTGRLGKEFYISSITVAAVPVPAAGLMLLTGLGGIAVARRRRKQA